jgi:hypothetical protein
MPKILDRRTQDIIEITEAQEMGWCLGCYWLIATTGEKIDSSSVDFFQPGEDRTSAPYEAIPAQEI